MGLDIYALKSENNHIFIKREDLLPYYFGGNKSRKAKLFFEDAKRQGCDAVVTYGTSQSNHCRVTANAAAQSGMLCVVISPEDAVFETSNNMMVKWLGAQILTCPVNDVNETINRKLESLREQGMKPYLIEGGGHGNIGTRAYVECYDEICAYEADREMKFDYIFLASGTGTTQAGLICGRLLHGDAKEVVGISVARSEGKGRAVVARSVRDYFDEQGFPIDAAAIDDSVIFTDRYVSGGYGKYNDGIVSTVKHVLKNEGIALDATYTGKAFWGMKEYLSANDIKGKNILFIHTGGQPIFFDDLRSIK